MAMEAQIAELLEKLRGLDDIKEMLQQQRGDLQALTASFKSGKPRVEKPVAHLQAVVGILQRQTEGVLEAPLPTGGSSSTDNPYTSAMDEGDLAAPTHTTCSMKGLSHDVDAQPSAAAIPNTTTYELLPASTLVHSPEVLAPITTSPSSPTAGMSRAADLDIVGVHVAGMSPRLEDVFRATPAIAVVYCTESLKLIVDSNLRTSTSTRCSTICSDDDMEVLAPMFRPVMTPAFMPDVIQNSKQQGRVLRPMPWPSFEHHLESTDCKLPYPTHQVHAALGSFSCELFPTGQLWRCWQGEFYNKLPSYEGLTLCQWLNFNGFHHEKLWDHGAFFSWAWHCQWWMVFVNSKGRLGRVHSAEPWSPLQGAPLYGMCTNFQAEKIQNWMVSLVELQSWHPPDQENHDAKRLSCLSCGLLSVVEIWQYLPRGSLLLLWPLTSRKGFSETVVKEISYLKYMDFINIGLICSEATQGEQGNCKGLESYACCIALLLEGAECFVHCDASYGFYLEKLALVRKLWKTYYFSFYWVSCFGLLQRHNMLLGIVLSDPHSTLNMSIKYRTEQQNQRSHNLLAAIELAPCTMHKKVLQTVEEFRELRPTIIAENNGSNNSVASVITPHVSSISICSPGGFLGAVLPENKSEGHWEILCQAKLKYGTSIWGWESCIWMLHSNEELYLKNWKKMTNLTIIQSMSSCSNGFASSSSIRHPVHEFSCKMSRATDVNLVANFEALLSGKLPWTSFCLPVFQPKHPWPFSVSTISTHQLLFHTKTINESVNILKIYSRLFQVLVAPLLGSQSASGCHLEQLWDPGGNTSSVWISQSLEEIASYQAILIGGRNSMDATEIPSSGEPTPFQGGRSIMVPAFIDYHNRLGAFLNQSATISTTLTPSTLLKSTSTWATTTTIPIPRNVKYCGTQAAKERHRLGVKPSFKEGGLLAASS